MKGNVMESSIEGLIWLFAISSGVASHLLTKEYLQITEPWYENKYFWMGGIGNIPALIGIIGHLVLRSLNKGS